MTLKEKLLISWNTRVTFAQVQPTGFVTVPRLWEKIYEKMQALAKETGGAKKMIGTWAKTCGLNYYQALKEGRWANIMASTYALICFNLGVIA